MSMEDVVVAFGRWTRPNVRVDEAELFGVFEIADENLVVECRAFLLRPKVVHGVEVGDVHASGVRRRTSAIVLLHVHAEENDVDAVDLLKGKDGFGSVGVPVGYLRAEVFLHSRLHIAQPVAGGENANGHAATVGIAVLAEKVIHALLERRGQVGDG